MRFSGALDRSFGIETTFTRVWRHRLVRDALERVYSLTAIFMGTCHAALNVARVGQRHRSGSGHLVSSSTIRRRWHACQSNLVDHAVAFDYIRLIDSTGDPPVEVARFGRGLEVYAETPAPWVVAFLAGLQASWR